nr:hypothetical protein Itr_chr09CG14520 [Ipomoea trifida]
MGAATITLILPQFYRKPASRTGKHRRRSQSCRRNPPLPICRVKNREGFHGSDSLARDDRSRCRRPTPEKQGKPETRGSSTIATALLVGTKGGVSLLLLHRERQRRKGGARPCRHCQLCSPEL